MAGQPDLWSASEGRSRHAPASSSGLATPSAAKPIGLWSLAWRRFRRHRMALVGLGILLVLASGSLLANWISPYSPIKTSLVEMLDRPSPAHPMGTDELGRDLFTRILHGGRVSLAVGFLAVALAVSIGSTVGAIAGFYGGWVDNILMRVVDFMIALPSIFVLILLATIYGTNPVTLVIVIGGLRWMGTARQVRGAFLSLREREFVEAARCLGASPARIILRHLLPNAVGPIIVASTLGISGAILAESSLSYLGLGIQPPMASWGNMLRNAQDQMVRAPWTAIFPGLMIFLTVVAVNSIGDGLRDALDPRKVEGR